MARAELVICGTGFEAEELEAFHAIAPAIYVSKPTELAAIPESERAGIRAIALKSPRPFGAPELSLFPALEMVASFGVGYDQHDLEAYAEADVALTNTPDVLNDDVADFAVALMLDYARGMRRQETYLRDGSWGKRLPQRKERKLSGGTVGIVGLGRIGREIADRLAAFKMEIHYHARSPKETPGWTYHDTVVDLARAVDWLVVAVVGGPETENLIDAEVLAALGARGVLINIARGTVVDEAALLDALERKEISGAALDVFLNEPQIDARFFALDNVSLQPHQASNTYETRGDMARILAENLIAFFDGKPLVTQVR